MHNQVLLRKAYFQKQQQQSVAHPCSSLMKLLGRLRAFRCSQQASCLFSGVQLALFCTESTRYIPALLLIGPPLTATQVAAQN